MMVGDAGLTCSPKMLPAQDERPEEECRRPATAPKARTSAASPPAAAHLRQTRTLPACRPNCQGSGSGGGSSPRRPLPAGPLPSLLLLLLLGLLLEPPGEVKVRK